MAPVSEHSSYHSDYIRNVTYVDIYDVQRVASSIRIVRCWNGLLFVCLDYPHRSRIWWSLPM